MHFFTYQFFKCMKNDADCIKLIFLLVSCTNQLNRLEYEYRGNEKRPQNTEAVVV